MTRATLALLRCAYCGGWCSTYRDTVPHEVHDPSGAVVVLAWHASGPCAEDPLLVAMADADRAPDDDGAFVALYEAAHARIVARGAEPAESIVVRRDTPGRTTLRGRGALWGVASPRVLR